MLYNYSNLYFPVGSMFVALLVTILFFSKKNIKNSETKVYSKIVILTLIESIYTFCLTLFVHLFFCDSTLTIFAYANKILYGIYILWISLIFSYFLKISNFKEKTVRILGFFSTIMNLIFIFAIFLSKIDLIYLVDEKVSNSYGEASLVLYIGCLVYIVMYYKKRPTHRRSFFNHHFSLEYYFCKLHREL